MEPNTLLPTPKPSRDIYCPSCPRRFSSRKALEDHSRALHTSLSPSQTEAIAASVSQAKAINPFTARKFPSRPVYNLGKQQKDCTANKPSPSNGHPKYRPGHNPPTSTPPPPSSRPPNATPDPIASLTSHLLSLSLASANPATTSTPTPPPEPPSTDLDNLIRESHRTLGYGCLLLTTDIDVANDEYFLSFELHPPETLLRYSPEQFKEATPAAPSQPRIHITGPLPRAAPPSNASTPRIGNFVPAASSISTEWSEIVFPKRNARGGARRVERAGGWGGR